MKWVVSKLDPTIPEAGNQYELVNDAGEVVAVIYAGGGRGYRYTYYVKFPVAGHPKGMNGVTNHLRDTREWIAEMYAKAVAS